MLMGRLFRGVLKLYLIIALVTTGFIGFISIDTPLTNMSSMAANNSYVVDINGNGNFTTIQAAIDNASSGDIIYVWSGYYQENLVVNKTITMIGNGTYNSTIDGFYRGYCLNVSASWVNITGFEIIQSKYEYGAIYLNSTNNCRVWENIITSNYAGVFIENGNENSINNNDFSYNYYGVYLKNSNNNSIYNNTFQYTT